jgi:hypothetical protein
MSANLSASNVTRWETFAISFGVANMSPMRSSLVNETIGSRLRILKRGRKAIAKTSPFGRGDNY